MSEPFIGQIQPYAFNFAPRGWALCDGQLLPISSNSALFSLIGTTYGGDGKTTFALPDLRGRSPMHQGHGPGLSARKIGQKAGTEYDTLTVAQMPSHNHSVSVTATLRANSQAADHPDPANNTLSFVAATRDVYNTQDPDVDMHSGSVVASGTVSNNGGSQPFPIMQPYLVINYCIALVGIFPSRS